MAKEDPLLIVTGTPRSGTTRMAAFCLMMSNSVGGNWNRKNSSGGFEDPFIANVNERIIKRAVSEVDVQREFELYRHRVLKLPQFVTYGDLAPIEKWRQYRPQIRILLMVRDVHQVAKSMESNGMKTLDPNRDTAAEILALQLKTFQSRIAELEIPCHELRHPEFIDDTKTGLEVLDRFAGLNLQPHEQNLNVLNVEARTPPEIWSEWFDKSGVTLH